MAARNREIKESPLYQGRNERIAYDLTTTPWGGTPASPTAVIRTWPEGDDVSSTNLSGTASVNGDVITTPLVVDLTEGQRYRFEIRWINSGNTFEAYADIIGEP